MISCISRFFYRVDQKMSHSNLVQKKLPQQRKTPKICAEMRENSTGSEKLAQLKVSRFSRFSAAVATYSWKLGELYAGFFKQCFHHKTISVRGGGNF